MVECVKNVAREIQQTTRNFKEFMRKGFLSICTMDDYPMNVKIKLWEISMRLLSMSKLLVSREDIDEICWSEKKTGERISVDEWESVWKACSNNIHRHSKTEDSGFRFKETCDRFAESSWIVRVHEETAERVWRRGASRDFEAWWKSWTDSLPGSSLH